MSARVVTDAQYKMLCSARKHGNAFHHLRLEQYHAALRTRDLLIDRGWLRFGAVFVEITDAGVREAFIYEPADYEWSWSVSIPVRPATIVYRADCPDPRGAPWKSPVCMPESLSRLTLVIESVRVQRVQDISEEDARAEGMPSVFERFPGLGHDQRLTSGELMAEQPHRAAYAVAWDGRNGGACLWKSNPWVFALTFKRQEAAQ